jgi:hypothetical protein
MWHKFLDWYQALTNAPGKMVFYGRNLYVLLDGNLIQFFRHVCVFSPRRSRGHRVISQRLAACHGQRSYKQHAPPPHKALRALWAASWLDSSATSLSAVDQILVPEAVAQELPAL